MKRWTRFSTVALIGVIGVLLPVLAALQYHWLGEISRLEQQHMTDNLRSATRRFSGDFDTELAQLYQACHVRKARVQEAPAALSQLFKAWARSVSVPEIVKAIYWVEVFEKEEPKISRVDVQGERFERIDWPAELEPAREVFAATGHVDPLQDSVPALVVPQHGTKPVPWAVVVLDVNVLTGKFLSERVTHFLGDTSVGFDAAIVDNEDRDHVVYTSSPGLSADELIDYKRRATIGFFGLHSRDFRFDWIEALPTSATEHRWRLYIRHKPGALAAAVGAVRARNLLVSFGMLMLLGGSILVLMLTTRRAQRWARLQLEYVARIAHELRTPLAVIGFASENLADDVVSDLSKARTYGQVIHKESRRLSKLVESALLHSRLESGSGSDMERQPVRIPDVIEAALEDTDVSDADVRTDVSGGLPTVLGDREALKSALQNLFANALKYSGDCHHLSISAKERAHGDGRAVEIRVEDRGPGIPSSELPHIFEPFFRGRVARKEQIEGSGIGLSLVKHVVDAHGGTIRVTSPEGGGSRFTLLLPAGA